MEQVIAAVAGNYVDNVVDIIRLIKGPHRANEAKKLAMYLYQQLVIMKLADIA